MHEAGVARTVAETLRAQRIDGAPVRLLVRGGHAEPDAFDAAFRFHLAAAAPELAEVPLHIVHLPSARLCVGCGRSFDAAGGDVPCPTCGGASLAIDTQEHIELEIGDAVDG